MSKSTWLSAAILLLVTIGLVMGLDRKPPSPATKRLLLQFDFDELLKPSPPRTPAEALASFETIPGFQVELVASEPDVASPVAATFDADGRLYVAEMRDYPFRPAEGEKPLGRVRMLEDRDGDGRFETSHIFAEELLWP